MVVKKRLTFGQEFKAARLAAGLTQKEVSDIAKVATNHISAIERGAKFNLTENTMRVLAEAVGMQLEVRLIDPRKKS